MGDNAAQRVVQTPCGWCNGEVVYSGRGTVPTYCSRSCKQRAYEVRTALRREQADAARGRIRAQPAERIVERVAPFPANLAGWERALKVLRGQLGDGTLAAHHHDRLAYVLRETLAAAEREQRAVHPVVRADMTRLQLHLEQSSAAVRPVTIRALADTSQLPIAAVRDALAGLQRAGTVRLAGAGDAAVDPAAVAEHVRFRALPAV